jgi:hypothetical protein
MPYLELDIKPISHHMLLYYESYKPLTEEVYSLAM